MRIIVAGGTGFVGRALVHGLLDDEHQVVIMRRSTIRPGSKSRIPEPHNVEVIYLNPEEPIVSEMLTGDAVINLVGIIREFPSRGITFHKAHFLVTKHLVDFARQKGIRRFMQMSALGVRPQGKTGYEKSKYAAEQYVVKSGLDWTIFRPSVIFGPNDHVVEMFANMIKLLPFVPIVGDGNYKLSPVHIDDVVMGFRKALKDPRAIGRIFEFGGPETMTFNGMLDTIGAAIGAKKVRKVNQPVWLMRAMSSAMERFPWYPLSNEQITMLLKGNYTADKAYFEFFDIIPKRLLGGITEYMASKKAHLDIAQKNETIPH